MANGLRRFSISSRFASFRVAVRPYWKTGLFCIALAPLLMFWFVAQPYKGYYPICSYGALPSLRTKEALQSRLKELVSVTAGREAQVALSPNGRVAVVSAVRAGHKALIPVWARAACIGPTQDEEQYRFYKKCVELLTDSLEKHNGLSPLGKFSDALGDKTLYCGYDPGEAKTPASVTATPGHTR